MKKFEVKVKYPLNVDGKLKTATDVLLIEGDSFGEVEDIAKEENEDYDVVAIKVSNIENTLGTKEDGVYFMCENKDVVVVGDKETKRTIKALVNAEDDFQARVNFIDWLQYFDADVDIVKLQKSPITYVILRDVKEEGE